MNRCVPTVEARASDWWAWCQEPMAVAADVSRPGPVGRDAMNLVDGGVGLAIVTLAVYVLVHHLCREAWADEVSADLGCYPCTGRMDHGSRRAQPLQ